VLFFVSLVVDGALAGAIYALIALAFVVVYKASRMVNFALGEWAMLGTRFVATGLYATGLGLPGAIVSACAATVVIAMAFNRLVLRHLIGRPLISVIMVTLGLGAVLRGAAPLVFGGIPNAIPLPIPP
jgi:branched-chain amino acid transport system permease protein